MFTKQMAIDFLKALGSKKIDMSTAPWISGQCPMAPWTHEKGSDSNPSFGVLTGKSPARCHCFSCNFSSTPEGVFGELLMRTAGELEKPFDLGVIQQILDGQEVTSLSLEDPEEVVDPVPTPFPEAWWESFLTLPPWHDGYTFLRQKRGLSQEEIAQFGFKLDPILKRVCLPVRGFDQQLYGVRGRTYMPAVEPKYWSYPFADLTNPTVWYGEDEVNFDEPVLVVESVFDRIAARRVYKNVIAPLSASITKAQTKRVEAGYLFIHLFDGDKAGARGSKRLKAFLPHAEHVVLTLPSGQDPGGMSKEELQALLGPYTGLTLGGS